MQENSSTLQKKSSSSIDICLAIYMHIQGSILSYNIITLYFREKIFSWFSNQPRSPKNDLEWYWGKRGEEHMAGERRRAASL